MNVAFLTPEYPPLPSGGIGTATQQLARGLVAAGHGAWVIAPGPDGVRDDHGVRVRFHDIAHPRGMGWFVVRRALAGEIRRLSATDGVDLVVAPDWLGLSAGMRTGIPIAVACNGSATYFGAVLHEPVRRQVRAAERLALRSADAVSAVSTFTATETQALFGLDHTPTVIHNGVDLARFPDHDAPPEPGVIVHLGTLVRKKGTLDLTEAFSGVADAHPTARLVVAGRDAPDRLTGAPSTWDLAATTLTPHAATLVDRLGPVDHDEVATVLRRAALCLFPSHAEANPVAWLEAMAAGRAIVGYAHPWATEIVEHGVTGWLVPPGDVAALTRTVVECLEDPERLRTVGRRARKEAERRFSVDVLVERSVRWYAEVLDGCAHNGSCPP